MDFQEQIRQMVELRRKKTFAASPQITLGHLIELFTPILKSQAIRLTEGKEDASVVFDFEYLFPCGLKSWRGSYSELAFSFCDYDNGAKPLTVTKFHRMITEAVGKSYDGYKGGEFIMSNDTPLWVANYGNSGNTGVVGIKDNGYEVVILTAYCEF